MCGFISASTSNEIDDYVQRSINGDYPRVACNTYILKQRLAKSTEEWWRGISISPEIASDGRHRRERRWRSRRLLAVKIPFTRRLIQEIGHGGSLDKQITATTVRRILAAHLPHYFE